MNCSKPKEEDYSDPDEDMLFEGGLSTEQDPNPLDYDFSPIESWLDKRRPY